MEGGPPLYIGLSVRLEGFAVGCAAGLAAHTSVRPHTPLLVCLAGFCDATPFLILPKVHIYDILSLKH